MFATQFGILSVFLLSCCNKGEGRISLQRGNTASVALPGDILHFNIQVNIPANSTDSVYCYHKESKKKIWTKSNLDKKPADRTEVVHAKIPIRNSSDSGEYFFKYMEKEIHWMVLVRDVGYIEPDESVEIDVICMLVVTMLLLLFSVIGSIYIYKWHKDHALSGGDSDGGRKRGNTVVARDVGNNSESVYTDLEPRPVSIYDVLSVDEVRRESTKRHASKKMDNTPHKEIASEEGTFESVYENF